jgi:hypothetical protein
VASARVLVDTPDSQVVSIATDQQASNVSGSLGPRASLLSQLMTQGQGKAAIARHAGVDPRKLVVVAATTPDQAVPSLRDADVLVYRPLTDDSGNELPIIGIDAQAANGQRAAMLANAAVAGLQDYLRAKAVADGVPPNRQVRARGLSIAQGQDIEKGPGPLLAAGAAIAVFGILCTLMLIGFALVRNWRAAAAAEHQDPAEAGGWRQPAVAPRPVAFAPAPTTPLGERPAPAAKPPTKYGERAAAAARDHERAPHTTSPSRAPAHRWSDPPV